MTDASTTDMRAEMPSLRVPGSPVFASANGFSVTDTSGREYVDLAMGFGTQLYGHGAQRGLINQILADSSGGLGDLYSHELRERATSELCAALAPLWSGTDGDANELRCSIWHTGSEA